MGQHAPRPWPFRVFTLPPIYGDFRKQNPTSSYPPFHDPGWLPAIDRS